MARPRWLGSYPPPTLLGGLRGDPEARLVALARLTSRACPRQRCPPQCWSDPLRCPSGSVAASSSISKASIERPRGELAKWRTIMKLNWEQKWAGWWMAELARQDCMVMGDAFAGLSHAGGSGRRCHCQHPDCSLHTKKEK